jgi:cytidylate kinase
MSQQNISIAIDGPAGAGKSTVAKQLAKELNAVYIDSGAMYRAVAWACVNSGVDQSNEAIVSETAKRIRIRFILPGSGDDVQRIEVDGVDATSLIRTEQISQAASAISAIPAVRACLVAEQQELARCGSVVMEGRDIGTVVLPDAQIKIFLTASIEERARRRFEQNREKGDASASFETIKEEIRIRDERDSTRATSPLKAAPDAVWIDSDHLGVTDVVAKIKHLAEIASR